MALRTKKVTINDQEFNIGSLSVRQFGALMAARVALFGEDPKPEDYKKQPLDKVAAMEAEFLLMPSLNNAMPKIAPLGQELPDVWTVDRILDEFDYETMRELTRLIMDFMNIQIKPSATGPQAVSSPGESQAAAS